MAIIYFLADARETRLDEPRAIITGPRQPHRIHLQRGTPDCEGEGENLYLHTLRGKVRRNLLTARQGSLRRNGPSLVELCEALPTPRPADIEQSPPQPPDLAAAGSLLDGFYTSLEGLKPRINHDDDCVVVNPPRAAEPIHIDLTLNKSVCAAEPMHIDLNLGEPTSPTSTDGSGCHADLATKAAAKKRQKRALKRWRRLFEGSPAERNLIMGARNLNNLAPNATLTKDAWSLAEGSEGAAALRCSLLCKLGHTADCLLRTIDATPDAALQLLASGGESNHV